jgi:cell wall-associated NlpC family hydrolase
VTELPDAFWQVPYDGARIPGATGPLAEGANCQRFAYAVLAHLGRDVPNFRSSELWEDQVHTQQVRDPEPLDLVLFSKDQESYGAHVGVVWGDDLVLHLCKEIGKPALWSMADFAARPRYQVVVGYKRAANWAY